MQGRSGRPELDRIKREEAMIEIGQIRAEAGTIKNGWVEFEGVDLNLPAKRRKDTAHLSRYPWSGIYWCTDAFGDLRRDRSGHAVRKCNLSSHGKSVGI